MKRFATFLLALVMILSLTIGAAAQTVGTPAEGKGSITIENASKGVEYKVYKLFDATVSADNASIAYTGTIPESLSAYFTEDSVGNITATDAAKNGSELSEDAIKALTEWAKTASATVSAVSDGSELVFAGLEYGYYVVTTTQGTAISVDSTNPNATIIDKNTTPPISGEKKEADKEDYSFGDTITYTVSFNTANYDGEKQIVSYTIADTLPNFLANVKVTSITIDGVEYLVNGAVPQFENKQITIPWAENGVNNYANGAKIVITYTAVLTEEAAIAGAGNKNEATISYKTEDDKGGQQKVEDIVYTYAIALKKVDQNGNPLAGAEFEFPFYVKATPDEDGAYIYAGITADNGLINKITTPADGVIIVKGVKPGDYSITETKAPAGYNMLTTSVTITATKTSETTTSKTVYLDKNGNIVNEQAEGGTTVLVESDKLAATAIVVVNKTGSELPSTGGMGTTMFYLFGGIMVLAAVVLLVTKKRMSNVQ